MEAVCHQGTRNSNPFKLLLSTVATYLPQHFDQEHCENHNFFLFNLQSVVE